jgi:hypothetical protein
MDTATNDIEPIARAVAVREPVASSAKIYGRQVEGVHFAGYSFERVCTHLEWLLEGDRWKLDGEYDDVDKFLDSIKLDAFHVVAEQRKRIAQRIKALQPAASQRAIAKVVGVTNVTVHRDFNAENGGAGTSPVTNVTPPPRTIELTGAAAAPSSRWLPILLDLRVLPRRTPYPRGGGSPVFQCFCDFRFCGLIGWRADGRTRP